MLEIIQSTRINSDASEDDLKPGEYRDALNISLMANELGAFSKGTTFGNIDTNIIFKGLNPDAICLGTAIDTAGIRSIITFYQKIPVPFTAEYNAVLNYAFSKGYEPPSPQVQASQNFLIALLKKDGIWTSLDVFFCFFGDGDENFAKINWKNPSDITQAVNHGMAYAIDSGFAGNGISAFLDTKFIPSTGIKFLLNNASFTVGYDEIVLSAGSFDGAESGVNRVHLAPYTAVNTLRIAINGLNSPAITNAQIINNAGLIFVSRPNAGNHAVRKNVSDSFLSAEASAARPTTSFYLGAINDDGVATSFTSNKYSLFAAGESMVTFDRETNFYKHWLTYLNSFVTPILSEAYAQEVLMYLLTLPIGGTVYPLVKSSLLNVEATSYLDGYSFVNELFFFNFRESAPKVINIERALNSPGFYDNISETSLTIIKPHPPFSPVAVRDFSPGPAVNPPIQKKPFQFMMVYRFVDGEQSTKSPASEYLNSLDDRDALTSNYDHIDVTMTFPIKDYSIVKEVELYVRNNNAIADWRSVNIFVKTLFAQAGDNYSYVYEFRDNVVGNFFPLELSTKINDSIPQKSNYLAFIENRIFLIDSLVDYDYVNAFQLLITLDVNPITPDDRLTPPLGIPTPLYAVAEFEWDSEYSVGLAFYDRYGRKYPSSQNDRKLVTPAFVPSTLPVADFLPDQSAAALTPLLNRGKITAKYDIRAAGNIANYGKPPKFAFWWGMIRSKNTKWEFQQSIQCLLRFPYSITKWTDTDPASFPNPNLFLEDGYLYWDPAKLLAIPAPPPANLTTSLVNDYIDVVIPPNFPYPLDSTILIDFMMRVCTDVNATKIEITNREVIEIFANKIRIRGDRAARWFSNDPAGLGQYYGFPKFTTGINLSVPTERLRRDETLFSLIIKRHRQNSLESIILYDTPQIYPVQNPGTSIATFQPSQAANINVDRVEFVPPGIPPAGVGNLVQGDIIIQPILVNATTIAFNHAIKITWGVNTGNALRLKIKASIWQLNNLNQPVQELFSATGDAGGDYRVKNGETLDYFITTNELLNGWYGYGIQILTAEEGNIQFENPDFDDFLRGWRQSPVSWLWGSNTGENYAYVRISELAGNFSTSLYQILDGTVKEDLQIEVTVEGLEIQGPASGGAVVQFPGSAQTPAVNNSNEALIDQGRNIVPYFIDCSTVPREVTLVSIGYQPSSAHPVGSQVRAEVWRIDQVTKRPISLIEGSEGAWTPIPNVAPYIIPFGVNNVVDTSGWYGVAIAFDGPTFSDFTNSNYQSGAAYWITTSESPQWVYQGDTNLPPSYQDLIISPALGASQGYKTIGTKFNLISPLFFPVTLVDPTGYDQHRIIIDWGDNVPNGWHGKSIIVGIWEVDQGTMKPLTTAPLMSSTTDIRSGGPSEHFISNAQKLVGNKWYGIGLRTPSGHSNSTGGQFTNPSFSGSVSPWALGSGTQNWQWANTVEGGLIFIECVDGPFPLAVSSGIVSQTIAKFAQVVLPRILISPDAGSPVYTLFADVLLNGVVKQTLPILQQNTDPTSHLSSVVFDAFNANGGTVGVRIYGTANNALRVYVLGIYNSFDPYLYSTPIIAKYAVSNPLNEAWVGFGGQDSPVDFKWSEAYTFWKFSDFLATTLTWPRIAEGIVGTSGSKIHAEGTVAAGGITRLMYSDINTSDAASVINFSRICSGSYNINVGLIKIEWWMFNDPANFTGTGVLVDSILLGAGSGDFSQNISVNFPAGYRYIGFRFVSQGGTGQGSVKLGVYQLVPLTSYFSWYKDGSTLGVQSKERQVQSTGGFSYANFHFDNLAPGAVSGRIGQDNLAGLVVKAFIELYAGNNANSFDVILSDTNGIELGRLAIVGRNINVNAQETIVVVNPPSTTGLYISIENKNAVDPISARIRGIQNVNVPVTIQADNTIVNAKTWQMDSLNNLVELATTSVTQVNATDDVPQPPLDLTVVLADGAGEPISLPQTFTPNIGPVVLTFSPTQALDGNFTYGIKVQNAPTNNQIAGIIKLLKVLNVAVNDGVAHIITHPVSAPLSEAWLRFDVVFAHVGYITNFIAVVDDLIMPPFTPVAINPTSYHLVANVVSAPVEGHSLPTPGSTYNYGIVYPSISSDPDAAGIVYEQKTGQSIGDINVRIIDLGEKDNSNIVRWSDPIIAGTSTNNLNAFLDSNKYAVDFQRGAIQVMIAMHDHTLFCVHVQGMSSLYVQRATMTSAAEAADQGDEPLFLTNKVIGNDNKLTSNLGTVNPESVRVVESGTVAYGFDLIRKSFWQKTNNGVRNLTYECNAKKTFNEICFYRLKAHLEGEDVKIYAGYNEKQKTYYLTFAPFIYRGVTYPAVTIAYCAYIDGFLSRYSFEPISYLATEDVLHTIKARELNDPDFFGDFSFWQTNSSTSSYIWLLNSGFWNDLGYWVDDENWID